MGQRPVSPPRRPLSRLETRAAMQARVTWAPCAAVRHMGALCCCAMQNGRVHVPGLAQSRQERDDRGCQGPKSGREEAAEGKRPGDKGTPCAGL